LAEPRSPDAGTAGRPPLDDTAALEAVRHLRAANRRLTYHAAALRYARSLPAEPGASKPESVARRLADKLRKQDGVRQRKANTKHMLREVQKLLYQAYLLLEKTISER
jgi:hypothetical protein